MPTFLRRGGQAEEERRRSPPSAQSADDGYGFAETGSPMRPTTRRARHLFALGASVDRRLGRFPAASRAGLGTGNCLDPGAEATPAPDRHLRSGGPVTPGLMGSPETARRSWVASETCRPAGWTASSQPSRFPRASLTGRAEGYPFRVCSAVTIPQAAVPTLELPGIVALATLLLVTAAFCGRRRAG